MASRKPANLQEQTTTVERRVFLGIGDAVLRLIHVERMYADGVDPTPELVAERDLIVEALNQQYQLDLGMDCDMDGIPDAIDDDVSVLTTAAQTSCCRILPQDGAKDSSRVEPLPTPPKETPQKKTSPKKAASSKKESTPSAKKSAPAKKAAPKRTSRKTTSEKSPSRKATASRKKAASVEKKPPAPKSTAPAKKKKGLLSSIFGADEEK